MPEEEKKKKNVKLDEDVAEMCDVYCQIAGELAEQKIVTTPDAIEAMAVSLLIDRKQTKRATARQTQPNAPSNPSAGSTPNMVENERECPSCHAILVRKFKEGGSPRGYFSCTTCKCFVNDDGKTVAWKKRT